jgi:hypothetical protein
LLCHLPFCSQSCTLQYGCSVQWHINLQILCCVEHALIAWREGDMPVTIRIRQAHDNTQTCFCVLDVLRSATSSKPLAHCWWLMACRRAKTCHH